MTKLIVRLKGGSGSGFFGHSGRPGMVGGSADMGADKGGAGFGGTGGHKKLILPKDAFDNLLNAGAADIRYAASHRDRAAMLEHLASADVSTPKRKANADLLRSLIGSEAAKPSAPKLEVHTQTNAVKTPTIDLSTAQSKFASAKAASGMAYDYVQSMRTQYGEGHEKTRAAKDALQSSNIAYNKARAALLEAGGKPQAEALASLTSKPAEAPAVGKVQAKLVAATPASKLPDVNANGGKDLMQHIYDKMQTSGLKRTSTMNGGEIAGHLPPNRLGSTGFSFRDTGDGLEFHIVLSGKPITSYTKHDEIDSTGDRITLHTPVNQSAAHPKIKDLFKSLGFTVKKINNSGYQQMWDDDLEYTVATDYGRVGKPAPIVEPRRRW